MRSLFRWVRRLGGVFRSWLAGKPARPAPWRRVMMDGLESREFLSVAINDISVVEGNSGATQAVFTISMDSLSITPIAVHYVTVDGTAKAGTDYQAVGGSIIFYPGMRSADVQVPIIPDTTPEPNKTFTMQISSPTGVDFTQAIGTCTIIDDDRNLVTLTVPDAKASETNADPGVFRIAPPAAPRPPCASCIR